MRIQFNPNASRYVSGADSYDCERSIVYLFRLLFIVETNRKLLCLVIFCILSFQVCRHWLNRATEKRLRQTKIKATDQRNEPKHTCIVKFCGYFYGCSQVDAYLFRVNVCGLSVRVRENLKWIKTHKSWLRKEKSIQTASDSLTFNRIDDEGWKFSVEKSQFDRMIHTMSANDVRCLMSSSRIPFNCVWMVERKGEPCDL